MRFQFNTGRLYSAAGQRIVVEVLPEGQGLIFNDIDRWISGSISEDTLRAGMLSDVSSATKWEIRYAFMWCYDHGYYNLPPHHTPELEAMAKQLEWRLK